jgi:hypothetical protein
VKILEHGVVTRPAWRPRSRQASRRRIIDYYRPACRRRSRCTPFVQSNRYVLRHGRLLNSRQWRQRRRGSNNKVLLLPNQCDWWRYGRRKLHAGSTARLAVIATTKLPPRRHEVIIINDVLSPFDRVVQIKQYGHAVASHLRAH